MNLIRNGHMNFNMISKLTGQKYSHNYNSVIEYEDTFCRFSKQIDLVNVSTKGDDRDKARFLKLLWTAVSLGLHRYSWSGKSLIYVGSVYERA